MKILLIIFSIILLFLIGILIYIIINFNNIRIKPTSSLTNKPTDKLKKKPIIYKLTYDYSGDNLDKMNPRNIESDWKFSPFGNDFFENGDPTHGIVQYGDNFDLIKIINKNNKKQLKIDIENKSNNNKWRKAPRIHFIKKTFDEGLFILDLDHLPFAPGLWPSFWFKGLTNDSARWACNGEIDVIEGITDKLNKSTTNYSTLHTNIINGDDCIQNIPEITNKSCSAGDIGYYTCGCSGTENCPNLGCGIHWKNSNTFGKDFNDNGGGTYAIEISKDKGITIWFWPRNDPMFPEDFKNENISTTNWQTQKDNKIQFNACPNHFKNLVLIINTTLCGDWAGSVYDPNDKNNSQKECQGYATDPNVNITNGYWLINYFKIYETIPIAK